MWAIYGCLAGVALYLAAVAMAHFFGLKQTKDDRMTVLDDEVTEVDEAVWSGLDTEPDAVQIPSLSDDDWPKMSKKFRFKTSSPEWTRCIFWDGSTHRDGGGRYYVSVGEARKYGHEWAAKKTPTAHRWLYAVLSGANPEGLAISHTCGQPDCVRPSHLRARLRADQARTAAKSMFG